ncbi:hypothetical protein MKK75_11475 [Methylobacterium sp. J-030]|uniref:hypothetical protein n=1 Tax=Methylobacterium sp. J-030 TaxID=2836627 RepID=UPI001FBA6753|nr:hypothetical protein [Methylobacterium sp. J-030]MCJ2069404.1 hypothetical protein [Methylobacterium sp. J-030]
MTPIEIERPGEGDLVKVTTRLPSGLARAMRVAARTQDISIEVAYSAAVAAYFQKNG